MPPRVWNKRDPNVPADAVYVGRPTKWGNPFPIGRDRTRVQAINQFREWVMRPEQTALRVTAITELRGKDLVCWCVPDDCHAWVWIEIANAA